jgi:pimeloyl-ACP methyl ester carboxylesterase
MRYIAVPSGITLSFDCYGSGPPLVLVHGSFDNHHTNWHRVRPLLEKRFSIYAVDRRGRGETDATKSHGVEDEAHDIAALIQSIDEPVFLLGHSHGAQVSLAAAALLPHRVRKLVLYEPPLPGTLSREGLARLEAHARTGDWEGLAMAFFHNELQVPLEVIDELRASGAWTAIVADAEASMADIHAIGSYAFDPARFSDLRIPVLLQVGTETPRDLFATDTLAPVLPAAHVEKLPGQAHEAMQTAPELYASSVTRFLLS